MTSSGAPFELAVEPRNELYDPGDDRWRDQVATLYTGLVAEVDTVQRERTVAGAKGAVDQLIVALGSSGALTAAVECFRAWLGRDRARRIDVRWDENGTEHFVTLTGEAVDAETVREIAGALARRGESPA
jgi:Effector Associated Constant Component 1